MKKIPFYSLSFLLILSLALPAKGGLLSFNQSAKTETPFQSIDIKHQEVAVYVIVQEQANQVVVPQTNKNPVTNKSCLGLAYQELNLIQNASIVNLNQPADCFQLTYYNQLSSVTNLRVQPQASVLYKIVVSIPAQSLTSFYWSSNPLESGIPTLPLVVWGLVVLSLLTLKRQPIERNHKPYRNFHFSLNLQKLQILRC